MQHEGYSYALLTIDERPIRCRMFMPRDGRYVSRGKDARESLQTIPQEQPGGIDESQGNGLQLFDIKIQVGVHVGLIVDAINTKAEQSQELILVTLVVGQLT